MVGQAKRLSTIDYIYGKIKKRIIELTYEPDEHLVETTLAKEFEISRTPLRQALYRLELEGMIIRNPNGRMTVASMSIQEAKELFLVREVIEGLIAREACLYIANSNDFLGIIQKLEGINFLMRKAAEEQRRQDIVLYGSEFHRILQQYSNNTTAVNMLNQINNRVARYRRLGAYKDPQYPSSMPVEEHEEILKQIKKKDDVSTENSMRIHINRSLKNTVSAIAFL